MKDDEEPDWPIVYSNTPFSEISEIMEIFQSGFKQKFNNEEWDRLVYGEKP